MTLDLREHSVGDAHNLEAVFKVVIGSLGIVHPGILFLNKLFLLFDVLLDFFQKEVNGLLLVVLNSFELLKETIDVFWGLDVNEIAFALIHEILELSLGFLTRFDLCRVRKIVRRLLFIEINKVRLTYVSKLIHDVPSIVLRNIELIKPHWL